MPSGSEAIAPELIDSLIALGRAGVPGLVRGIETHDDAHRALVRAWPWSALVSPRSSDEIAYLIKGIVLLSQRLEHGIGGSVTPVVPLYRELRVRGAPCLNELSSWILAHRVNEYEPFGTWIPEFVRDHDGYMAWQALCLKQQQVRREAEIARVEEAEARRASAATAKLANAVRRGDVLAVKALLAQGARPADALPDGGSLQAFAASHAQDRMAELLREMGVD
jgi:hypothetical protein